MSKLRNNLAANLKHWRKKRNLSVEELAERCDIHWDMVYKLERGDRWVGDETLERLSDVLGYGPTGCDLTSHGTVGGPVMRRR